MCVVTALLETGMLPMTEPVTELTLEAPAGLIRVTADCADGKVTGVTFRNVLAFATHLDAPIEVPHLGTVTVDVAYGGMFYVIADAERVRAPAHPGRGRRHRPHHRDDQGRRRASSFRSSIPSSRGSRASPSASSPARRTTRRTARNVVTVSTGTLDWDRPATWTGAIDRSPCGTGTSAKMATLHAKGQLGLGEAFRHEGILGTVFTGRLVEEPRWAPTARRPDDHRPGLDHRHRALRGRPDGPVPDGFTVGDIWA